MLIFATNKVRGLPKILSMIFCPKMGTLLYKLISIFIPFLSGAFFTGQNVNKTTKQLDPGKHQQNRDQM